MVQNLNAAGLRSERGSVAVEFAMIAPLILILLAGAVDLGLLFREDQQFVEAVRVAGRAVAGFVPATASPEDELCQVAKQAVTDSFKESNIGDLIIDLQNVDLNSGGTIPGAGVRKAITISVRRQSPRPSFFGRLGFDTGASAAFYLESQTDVATDCTL